MATATPPTQLGIGRKTVERSAEEEYTSTYLDLGTESPRSILHSLQDAPPPTNDIWAKSGIAVNTQVPQRQKSWRSRSFEGKLRQQQAMTRFVPAEIVDVDCGICFETAVRPCRTRCCNTLFCMDHLSDWLYSPNSDGRCPACRTLCIPTSPDQAEPPSPCTSSYSDSETETDSEDGECEVEGAETPKLRSPSPDPHDLPIVQRILTPSFPAAPTPASTPLAHSRGASVGRGTPSPAPSSIHGYMARNVGSVTPNSVLHDIEVGRIMSVMGFTAVLLVLLT